MSHFFQYFYFSRNPLDIFFIFNSKFFKDFYSNFFICQAMNSKFNLSKCPFSQSFSENIMAKPGTFLMGIICILIIFISFIILFFINLIFICFIILALRLSSSIIILIVFGSSHLYLIIFKIEILETN